MKITKQKKLNSIMYIITVIFSVIFIFAGNRIFTQKSVLWQGQNGLAEKARIIEIKSIDTDEYSLGEGTSMSTITVNFKAEILSGEYKGKIVSGIQNIDNFSPYVTKQIEKGDKVLLTHDEGDNIDISGDWIYSEMLRTDKLMILMVAFLLLILLFGGKKGVNTIVSLGFTCLAIFGVFVPSVLAGANIYITSVIICLYTIIMTLVIVNGCDKKTLSAIIGCFSGVLLAGVITLIMNKILHLTGVLDETSIHITLLDTEKPIDLLGIIFGSIIIGAMGAVMDVSMSISSSLYELSKKVENADFYMLIGSGFTIGRDIMGTMANTLVLAYIGSSLSSVLLLIIYNPNILSLMNREMVVVEILQALVGSIGILFTIPFTSFIAAFLYSKKSKSNIEDSNVDDVEY
ncbi:YibE/F family protein [Tyzzerella sp. An114]|uniref:YibE/F family protein n=1 Tax=Tyzzerella sp. An114 TaxID=1965545 RepID=UPI001FA8E76C|nr:YibE/F family protein [Tyzzerella sp. An114]